MVSKPTKAHGAMAKVARMADVIPFPPVWAKSEMFAAPAPAARAALLSKPQIGCILMPFALLLMSAAAVSVNTDAASSAARMLCTMPAFFTPQILSRPKRIRIPIASSISPSQTSKPAIW